MVNLNGLFNSMWNFLNYYKYYINWVKCLKQNNINYKLLPTNHNCYLWDAYNIMIHQILCRYSNNNYLDKRVKFCIWI